MNKNAITTRADVLALLEKHDACQPSIDWVSSTEYATAAEIWQNCQRPDWMLWIAARFGIDSKLLVRAAVECAKTALKYTKDQRVHNCIAVTERWLAGEASVDEVQDARRAAYAAAAAAYAAAAAAADAAADAYAAAAAAAAREKMQIKILEYGIGLISEQKGAGK